MKESPEVGTPEGEMPPSFPPERLEEASTQASPSPGDQAGPAESGAAAGSEDSEPDEDLADDKRLAEDEKRASFLRSSLETLAIVAVALLVSVVIKTFFVQAFYVPSGSMESTLKPGDRIAVNRMVDSAGDINRGDVVVFVDPGNWLGDVPDNRPAWRRGISNALQTVGLLPADSGKHLVKRVIGVGGDRVKCCTAAGNLTVNGVELKETYLDRGVRPSEVAFDVVVPKGKLWVMGDNRSNSRDSRYHASSEGNGFVPVDNVVGRAWAIFYPFSRFGGIPSASSVFSSVPCRRAVSSRTGRSSSTSSRGWGRAGSSPESTKSDADPWRDP